MITRRIRFIALAGILIVSSSAHAADFETLKHQNWHQWRGPDASGVSGNADPPATWSGKENVKWKVPVDGRGSSTPIVWGRQVFLLTAVDTGEVDPRLPKPEEQPERPFGITYPNTAYEFIVTCFDRRDGRELWRRTAARKIPHEGHHGDNNFASASPTTDGTRLYAWFGMAGMFCYDLSGNLVWSRDLGPTTVRRSFGEASSPVLHGDRLVLVRDHDGPSYIVVLDANTGEEVWRADRDEQSTWMTPLVVERNGRTQVITNASNRVRSYDLEDGTVLWECGGQAGNVTPSPVTDGRLVFCMSGYQGSAAFALPLDASGDITGTDRIAWSLGRGTPYVPSPLLYDGLLYFNQSNNAILSCVDAQTGETVIDRVRMPGLSRVYASPVGAAGRVYWVGRDGTTLVIEHGREFKEIAVNPLGEAIDASPALVGNEILLRGSDHLFCISE